MSHRESEAWKKAESFRKAEVFGRAAKTFKQFWDDTGDPEAGWRYAHCLRRSGYSEVSIGILGQLVDHYPDHLEARDELVWSLYTGRLLPAKEQGDSQAVVRAAKEMVSAEAQGTALKLAVFAVMSASKSRGQWRLVCNWCDLLNPEELSAEERNVGKGTIPSDRERWYFAKLKSLVQLEEWHIAAGIAEEARRTFPNNANFVRWQAAAWAGKGLLPEALEMLETLRPKIAWYALADMARYSLEMEDVEGAWSFALEAAKAIGQLSAKVNLWELMSRLALALGNSSAALAHAGLMESLRREQSWPMRPSHRALIETVLLENDLRQLPTESSREWRNRCREHWGLEPVPLRRGPVATSESGVGSGKIVGLEQGRSFAFIAPAGGEEQVFVLAKDIPTDASHNGARVRFKTIKHFDKRKNRESIRAVSIEKAE